MDEMLRASIFLKAILPLMEDLVEFDPIAESAIAGKNLILQFEIKNGPSCHLIIKNNKIYHENGMHPSPSIRLYFKKGSCFSHPTELMVELAERLTSLISIADWAAFAKNGSDVTTWAIRIAREYTGRDKIVIARGAYHGAHAWCTAYPGGVMVDEKKHILPLTWNHPGKRLKTGLEELGQKHGFNVTVSGPPALPYMTFDDDPDLYHIQAFCRHMIASGIFLHPHHNWFICAAHTDADVDFTLDTANEVFPKVRQELDKK